jgi:integrase
MARARRGRGESAIYQRKSDGRWVAQISLGYDDDGRRRRLFRYGETKSAALAALDAAREALRTGQIRAPLDGDGPISLHTYLERWLTDHVKPSVSESTYRSREGTVRLHILPTLGDRSLHKIAAADVQRLYRQLEKDGVGGRTRQLVHATLRRAFNQAVRQGAISTNPLALVDAPRHVAAQIEPLTARQAQAFLDAIRGDRLETLFVLAIYTGLRQGELFALRWDDVDLRAGEIHVRRTTSEANDTGKPVVLDSPKTRAGRRPVRLTSQAAAALRAHRKRAMADAGGAEPSEYVFTDSAGQLLRRSNVLRRSYYPALAKAKLPRIRFHDLRHTFATLLLAGGVHPKVAQEMLGHAKISTTLDTYSHVLPTMQDEAIAVLEAALPRRRARK